MVTRSPDGWLCQLTNVFMSLAFIALTCALLAGGSLDGVSRARLSCAVGAAFFAVAGLAAAWSHRRQDLDGTHSVWAWWTAMVATHASLLFLGYAILRLLTQWPEWVSVALTLAVNELGPGLLPPVLMPGAWRAASWHDKLWIRFMVRWATLLVLGLLAGVATWLVHGLAVAAWVAAAMLVGMAGIGLQVRLKRSGRDLVGLDYNSVLHLFNSGIAGCLLPCVRRQLIR